MLLGRRGFGTAASHLPRDSQMLPPEDGVYQRVKMVSPSAGVEREAERVTPLPGKRLRRVGLQKWYPLTKIIFEIIEKDEIELRVEK